MRRNTACVVLVAALAAGLLATGETAVGTPSRASDPTSSTGNRGDGDVTYRIVAGEIHYQGHRDAQCDYPNGSCNPSRTPYYSVREHRLTDALFTVHDHAETQSSPTGSEDGTVRLLTPLDITSFTHEYTESRVISDSCGHQPSTEYVDELPGVNNPPDKPSIYNAAVTLTPGTIGELADFELGLVPEEGTEPRFGNLYPMGMRWFDSSRYGTVTAHEGVRYVAPECNDHDGVTERIIIERWPFVVDPFTDNPADRTPPVYGEPNCPTADRCVVRVTGHDWSTLPPVTPGDIIDAKMDVTWWFDVEARRGGACPETMTVTGKWQPWSTTVEWSATIPGWTGRTRVLFGRYGDVQVDVPGEGEVTTGRLTYPTPGYKGVTAVATFPGNPECDPVSATPDEPLVVDPIFLFAPSVRFKTDERLFAGDPGDFIGDSKLRFEGKKNGCKAKVLSNNPTATRMGTSAGANAYTVADPPTCTFQSVNAAPKAVQITSKHRYGYVLDHTNTAATRKGTLHAPVYAEFHGGSDPYVIYWLFYPHNDWRSAGMREVHEGDWERVILHLKPSTLEPDDVDFYQHHCTPDSRSFYNLDIDGDEDGNDESSHFFVYAAAGGHASYPHTDKHGSDLHNSCITERAGGYDYTGRGKIWRPWQVGVLNAAEQPWWGFGGAWGMRSDQSTGVPFLDNWGPTGPGPNRDPLAP